MKNRKLLLWFSLCVVIGIVAFCFFRASPQLQDPINAMQKAKHHKDTDNFPDLAAGQADEVQQVADPWDIWIDEQVAVQMEVFLEAIKTESPYDLELVEAQIDDIKAQMRAAFEIEAEKLKENSTDPPPIRVFDFSEFEHLENQEETGPKKHNGPQTVEALLESFEKMAADSEIDAKYPQVEWIQMLLDKGIVIEDFADYSGYLAVRDSLAYLENNPEMWQTRHVRIPLTEDWETFKAAYIDKKIWQYQQIKMAKQADPELSGGMFVGEDHQTFLSFKPGRAYINRIEGGGFFFGESLTEEQKFNILFRGIHPDKYDIVYIDENGIALSEPPTLITQEEIGMANRNQIEESMPTADLFLQTPQVDNEFVQRNKTHEDVFDEAQKFDEEVQNVQQGKEKTFQEKKAFLEFLEKVTRGDIEIETKLEKLLDPELQELPLDDRIETTLLKRFAPQRFERAIVTLQQYGVKDGLRRIRKTDSKVAAYLERILQPQFPVESQTERD